jgi:hypothetical protein
VDKPTVQPRPGEVRVQWTAQAGAFAYEVRRDGQPIRCGTFEAAVTRGLSWIDCDVANDTTYAYTVRAIANDGSQSEDSPVAEATPYWPTWQERGRGADINGLINNAPAGSTIALPEGIFRIQGDNDYVVFSKPVTLKATMPGRTQIVASRNWAPNGEAGCSWSGNGPWTSSLTVPPHQANEDQAAPPDANPFLARTYEHVCGWSSTGQPTEFIRLQDGSTPGEGEWCWPSGGDRHLRIGSDPKSFQRLEVTSGAKRFAQCNADGVTIADLIFQHIQGGERNSAIGNDDRANWTIRDCTIGYSHSGGPRCGDQAGRAGGIVIQRNLIHHCVHIGASSDNLAGYLLESNRFEATGYNWYDTMWEGGCTKFSRQTNGSGQYVFRNNEGGRGSRGFGLWFDERGDNPQVMGNRWQAPVNAYHFEISNGGSCEDNCWAVGEGGWTGWPTMYNSTSSNHTFRRNLVVSRASRGIQMFGDDTRGHAYTGNSSTDDTVVILAPNNGQQHGVFHNKPNMGPVNGTRFHFRNAPFLAVIGNQTVGDIGGWNANGSADGGSVLDQAAADAELRKWGVLANSGTPQPPKPVSLPLRVNFGSRGAYTDTAGNVWQADTGPSSGTATPLDRPGLAIGGTEDDALYQTEVWGDIFSYAWAVPDGECTVTLKFAEMYATAAGQRLFNVSLNGQRVLERFDIFAEVGANTACDKSFPLTISGGQGLRVDFATAGTNSAEVTAIEVVSGSVEPEPPDPEPPDHDGWTGTWVWVPQETACPHGVGATVRQTDGVSIDCPEGHDCWFLRWQFM